MERLDKGARQMMILLMKILLMRQMMILLMKNSKFLVVVELQYKLEVENPSFLMQKVLFCEKL